MDATTVAGRSRLGDRFPPRGARSKTGPVQPADVPVRALVERDGGDAFHLDRLGLRPTLRSLVGVTMVPAAPWLWRPATEALGRLVERVPIYRMRWSPEESPVEALDEALTA